MSGIYSLPRQWFRDCTRTLFDCTCIVYSILHTTSSLNLDSIFYLEPPFSCILVKRTRALASIKTMFLHSLSEMFCVVFSVVNKPFILSEETTASFGPEKTKVAVTVGGTVSVHTGTTLTIKCPVVGKPKPTVYWLSQGRPIAVGQAKTVGNNLVIENVNKIYALRYSCNARNRLGLAQAFTDVKVLGKQQSPKPICYTICCSHELLKITLMYRVLVGI